MTVHYILLCTNISDTKYYLFYTQNPQTVKAILCVHVSFNYGFASICSQLAYIHSSFRSLLLVMAKIVVFSNILMNITVLPFVRR